ncbi:MAG: ATP-binding protein [Candidatus Cloacimonetes bacterium]|nr:ATP-binding protein [Candidatus Cloacimonadota bacterium]
MDKHSLNRTLIIALLIILFVLSTLLVLKTSIWITLPVMTLVIATVLYLISRSLHKHYDLISDVVKQIAQGDISQRIPDMELDEFDSLGQNLNLMLSKLDTTIHHLAIHREELRLVLSSIEDVIWTQNLEGRLVWANEPFKRMFEAYEERKKQYYWEVIREPFLLKQIKDSETSKAKLMTELQLGDQSFLLSANVNKEAKRRVFILQDIAAIRQAEQMKKDFIANLAHELRTPLTAIKGFADAMQEKVHDENRRYLRIIQNHTRRLIHLISDLELLIKLERTSLIEKQEINLKTFFENIQLILEPHIEEKGLTLTIELDAQIPRLECDPFKLEQVFINLVQNSLRYTEKGGISIRSIALEDELLFEVCDTGKGMESIHLPRIFERFYVADPSRNRNNSGTGLGLAIVKHIVQLHQGKIGVQSEIDKGTCFQIYLPALSSKQSW